MLVVVVRLTSVFILKVAVVLLVVILVLIVMQVIIRVLVGVDIMPVFLLVIFCVSVKIVNSLGLAWHSMLMLLLQI